MGADIHVFIQTRPKVNINKNKQPYHWCTLADFGTMPRCYLWFGVLGYDRGGYGIKPIIELDDSNAFIEKFDNCLGFLPERWYDTILDIENPGGHVKFIVNPDYHSFGIISPKQFERACKIYSKVAPKFDYHPEVAEEYKGLLVLAQTMMANKQEARIVYCFDN